MGNIDSVPILSQYKSLVQVISGDAEGAKRTQENFLHTSDITAPFVALHHAIHGDNTAATKVMEKYATSKLKGFMGTVGEDLIPEREDWMPKSKTARPRTTRSGETDTKILYIYS